MAWDAEADELYPHTVTLVAPAAVRNDYGRLRDGSDPLTRRALVEHKMRMNRTATGEQTMSSITVYVNGSFGVDEITPDWKLTLPNGSSRPILSVDKYADEDGDLHEVVHLQ